MAFTEDIKGKFEAYGWQHILVKDGNDSEAIAVALDEAKAENEKPTIIEVKTIIGFGAEKQGTSAVHGALLGQEGINYTKKALGYAYPAFIVPEEVARRFEVRIKFRCEAAENAWNTKFAEYEKSLPRVGGA